jgi:hypothetical protein
MRSYPTTRIGKMPPTKFHLNKAGPFRVVNIDDTGSTYTLFNLSEGKEEKPCHITRLSKYEHVEDGLNITPQQAALVDSMQFYVEAIRDYRGSFNAKNPKDRKQPKLAFLVKVASKDTTSPRIHGSHGRVKTRTFATMQCYMNGCVPVREASLRSISPSILSKCPRDHRMKTCCLSTSMSRQRKPKSSTASSFYFYFFTCMNILQYSVFSFY